MKRKIDSIEKLGKGAKGRSELLKHLEGHRLTMKQAILAKCYDCAGFYADGKEDCRDRNCSLYPYMPYRTGEKTPFIERKKTNFNALAKRPGGSMEIISV